MQDRIRKALKGNQEAVLSLYDEHKDTVGRLCYSLLLEEKEADHATAYVFKKVFEELVAGRIPNETEFTRLTVRKTVMHCKALATKKSNRSFRVPMNSNFAATVYDPSKMDLTGDMLQIILKNLPTFHRYIYVLNTVCEYSVEQISRIFATTTRIIENALDSEQTNVEKIVAIARRKREKLPAYATQDFHSDLLQIAVCMDVPASVDATVKLNVQSLCEPILKAQRKKSNIILGTTGIVAVLLVILLVVLSMGGGENPDVDLDNADPNSTTASTEETTEPTDGAGDDVVASYYADIEIEGYGTITVALDAEAAPETVANFVSLAQSGFYDGLTFHRIIDGFMMQGGDPKGDGTGGNTDADGNEINITGEFSANGFDNPLSHTAGAISMARADDYNSASSQFFIVHTSDYTSSLDGLYACFGYVTEGMDIVDAICTAAEPTDDNGSIAAEDQPVITSITIREVEQSEESEDADATDSIDTTDGTDAADTTDGTDTAEDESNDSTETTDAADSTDAAA